MSFLYLLVLSILILIIVCPLAFYRKLINQARLTPLGVHTLLAVVTILSMGNVALMFINAALNLDELLLINIVGTSLLVLFTEHAEKSRWGFPTRLWAVTFINGVVAGVGAFVFLFVQFFGDGSMLVRSFQIWTVLLLVFFFILGKGQYPMGRVGSISLIFLSIAAVLLLARATWLIAEKLLSGLYSSDTLNFIIL